MKKLLVKKLQQKTYQKRCQTAGIGAYQTQSWTLYQQFGVSVPEQNLDAVTAYALAKTQARAFAIKLQSVAETFGCAVQCRPGTGLKDPARYLEKAIANGSTPTDILAAKFIVPTLEAAYSIALKLPEQFEVRNFNDRFLNPRASGYRDLQFQVRFAGVLAEIKMVIDSLDELDASEHRIYEVVRSLLLESEISPVQLIVIEDLQAASVSMYNRVWKMVIERI